MRKFLVIILMLIVVVFVTIRNEVVMSTSVLVCEDDGEARNTINMYRINATDDELVVEPFICFTDTEDDNPYGVREFTGYEFCEFKLGKDEIELYGCANYLRVVMGQKSWDELVEPTPEVLTDSKMVLKERAINLFMIEQAEKALQKAILKVPPLEEHTFHFPKEISYSIIANYDYNNGELLMLPFININGEDLTGFQWCKENISQAEIAAWGCENWIRWTTWNHDE